jgi:hypothetical protein
MKKAITDTVLNPSHPERICWGCDRYCAAHDLVCGNGTIRTPHPSELFGRDWLQWSNEHERKATARTAAIFGGAREISQPPDKAEDK